MSALTVVHGRDGDDFDYVDLAGELSNITTATDDALPASWCRVVFSVLVHNTDNYLPGLGLLRGPVGGASRRSST